jgi:superfamily II DNA or RNA helicase
MSGYLPPDYIDNQRATLAEVLDRAIRELGQRELDVASGYFNPLVWRHLREALSQLEAFRLLLGREPELEGAGLDRLDLKQYFRRKLREELEELPLDQDHVRLIDELLKFLQQESVHVKLYAKPFLHAKAYIFPQLAIVGSSNLTPAGLTRNSELNLVRKEEAVAQSLRDWFEGFWGEAEEYKPELIELLEASKFGGKPYSPYEVFIKVLYEYFKDRLPEAPEQYAGVELASFQQEGLHEALYILNKHRGVLIADAVGLGKTYIGMGLLEHYLLKGRRRGHIPKGLIVCPAQLRDLLWEPKLEEYGIKATLCSQEELGRRDFDWRRFIHYDVVLVDESHNFRNPVTQRYQHLSRLISSGQREKLVILMTATPINNTIWDLYHQLVLLTRGSDAYFRDWGIPNLKGFFRKIAQGEAEIFELLEETTVRRSRYDIKKRLEAGERITLDSKEIHFPERELESVEYDLVATYQGFYQEIARRIEALQLASYNLEAFKRDGQKDEIAKNNALIAILKTLWLKRLESSVQAFAQSIRNQQRFQKRFFELLLKNRLLSAADHRKILALEIEEEGDQDMVEELIAKLPTGSVADYDLKAIRRGVEGDLEIFDSLLERLEQILKRSQDEPRTDAKLERLKALLRDDLKDDKVLIFTYYQDTARYLYESLRRDERWQAEAGLQSHEIGLITGDTKPQQRERLVKRFAPISNTTEEQLEERLRLQQEELKILISTDVLSEGQNLQDARMCINYDLHWNPVRMIQRAGRIDRLGSLHEAIRIYNFFPEQGLEDLLGLVGRLQRRIADIDRTIGLDSSVLGEAISRKSLAELRRLKAKDPTLLEELEQASELLSLDEMRLPLIACLQELGEDHIKELPLGIYSGKHAPVEGFFFAFQAKDRHFWRFYPKDGNQAITDKRKIFRWIRCSRDTERMIPLDFSLEKLFPLLERATEEILQEIRVQQTRSKVKEPLKGLNLKFYNAIHQDSLLEAIPQDLRQRLSQALEEVALKPFERDPELQALWQDFQEHQDARALAEHLDEFFVEHELYRDAPPPTLEQIKAEDLRLVTYFLLSPS